MKKFAVLFIFIAFFIAACGGDDGGPKKENQNENEEEETEQSDADEVKELLYPEEVTPTSNKNGDIAQNITIYDDLDNERHLAEWYKPNNE